MELWDVYDINRNKTGKTAARGEVLPEGGYHLVVHVCIIGSDGRINEWAKEYDETEVTHRHVSHLYCIYPPEVPQSPARPAQWRLCGR